MCSVHYCPKRNLGGSERGGGEGGTRVCFGWKCASRVSEFGPGLERICTQNEKRSIFNTRVTF